LQPPIVSRDEELYWLALQLIPGLGARTANRLVVKNRGQTIFLDVTDIDWIEAAGYYACVHVGADTHIIRRTLLELAQDLGEERFVRIHRSTLVNLERIHGLELQDRGEYEVVLKSRDRLPLSRRYRKLLQQRLGAVSADTRTTA
jgi:two-component system LytT family response regulator